MPKSAHEAEPCPAGTPGEAFSMGTCPYAAGAAQQCVPRSTPTHHQEPA